VAERLNGACYAPAMAAGFGITPLASTPFGLGTPTPANEPPADPSTFSRYINPGSGDYERDPATGQLKQMPAIRQRVLLALKTSRGSSSVLPTFGFSGPKKIGANFEQIVRLRVRVALRQLTDVEKVARIESIVPTRRSGGRVGVVVVFTDLTQPNVPGLSPQIINIQL